MAKDAELERLRAEQNRAFDRKQQTWQRQEAAWNKREQIKKEMDRAHHDKQRAYDAQQTSWQHYQHVKSSNGPRIDSLNAQQENAYQNKKRAFDNASSAHDRRDGAAARRYADEGHSYKSQSQQYVAERRRFVEEIRSARSAHEPAKQQFQQAKVRFDEVKRRYDLAKAEHLRARDDFTQAKAEFDRAKKAFHSRLDTLKSQTKQRDKNKRALAEKAGVPIQYRDKVYVSTDLSGNVNLYFGGVGKPNGPGHGHYVMDKDGNVTYKRDPFDPHGAQNFTESQRNYEEVVISEVSKSGDFAFNCRFRGYDAYVESNINQENKNKIDIYYGPNGPFGIGHHHAVAYRESPTKFIYDRKE